MIASGVAFNRVAIAHRSVRIACGTPNCERIRAAHEVRRKVLVEKRAAPAMYRDRLLLHAAATDSAGTPSSTDSSAVSSAFRRRAPQPELFAAVDARASASARPRTARSRCASTLRRLRRPSERRSARRADRRRSRNRRPFSGSIFRALRDLALMQCERCCLQCHESSPSGMRASRFP